MDNQKTASLPEQQVSTGWEIKKAGIAFASSANATKLRLSDEMREAVEDVVNDAIRNAMKPGGMLYGR
ncbi:hypothetical protein APT61_12300 [Leclercia adecarboxylata]|uniref:hypothetical protein n=1 Tax=Leclercia adecarboxylata TaxID=83655 RepID=UPI000744CE92|nr:hypothetical protein [Leclercia adecarboxylata]ALZ96754.1 hypothetical protein APT61_12300 [Leclercia adecarboxylata]